jgi:hypothetical protein
MRTRVLPLLGCLLALSSQAQETNREIWVWKDANGVTHYSDRPVSGARRVEIAGVTPPSSAAAAPAQSRPAATPSTSRPAEAPAIEYRSLEIWEPENGASFFGADATVNVRMRSEPAVAAGHRLLLYLDGKLVQGTPNTLEYTIGDLDRGVHSLTAVITDDKGNEQVRSEPRVFHIKEASTIQPRAVGPALKPKPKTGS